MPETPPRTPKSPRTPPIFKPDPPPAPTGLEDPMSALPGRAFFYDDNSPPELVAQLAAMAAQFGVELKRRRPRAEKDEVSLSEALDTHVGLMSNALSEIGAVYNPATGMFKWERHEHTPDTMAVRIYGGMQAKAGLTKDSAKTAMATFVIRERVRQLEAARAQVLPYDPAVGDVELRRFVALMKDIPAPEDVSHLDVAAVQALIWQVKRKFAGHLKVEYPLMVVFSGGGGFGKSWTLEKLFAPVAQWTAGSMRLENLMNQFNMTVFNQYYVVPFEDMSPLTRNTREIMDTFKSIMTETHIAYRPPHERETHKLENHAACYGTTNFDVAECLPDYTGARRWWEIRSPNRKFSEVDAARLRTIDFARLWLSVDGSTSESPLRAHQEELTDVQNDEFKATTPLEDYFNDRVESDLDAPAMTQVELYDDVRQWFAEQGCKPPARIAVYKYVKSHGKAHGIRATKSQNIPEYHYLRLKPIAG